MMRKRFLLLLLFLSALIPVIHCNGPPDFFASVFQDNRFYVITGTAIMISITVIAIGKMMAEFMSSNELRAWVKAEMFETGASLLMVVLAGALVLLLGQVTHALAGSYDAFVGGGMFLEIIRSRLIMDYMKLMMMEVPLGILSTMGVHFMLPEGILFGVTIGTMPLSGLGMVSNANILLTDSLGTAIAVVQAQIVLLEFIRDHMLAFFFPLGILFRVFPVSRKVGSTIIAISLVLYFAYPLTLILNYYIYTHIEPIDFEEYESVRGLCAADEQDETVVEGKLGELKEDIEEARGGLNTTVSGEWYYQTEWHKGSIKKAIGKGFLIGWKTFVWVISLLVIDPRFVVVSFYDALIGWIQPVAQLLVIAFTFPIIDLIICITMFRSFSSTIGGEVELLGLARIV